MALSVTHAFVATGSETPGAAAAGKATTSEWNAAHVVTGGVSAWSSLVAYASGDIAIDRGGIWQATGSNSNSRPISGNANWTLIGGTPYVDATLNTTVLTTEPFVGGDGAGFTLIPAPGAGYWTRLLRIEGSTSSGDAWTVPGGFGAFIAYNGALGHAILTLTDDHFFGLSEEINTDLRYTVLPYIALLVTNSGNPVATSEVDQDSENQPINIWCGVTITGGTRSLLLRLYYSIEPV